MTGYLDPLADDAPTRREEVARNVRPMTDIIAEARDALEGVTAGPWVTEAHGVYHSCGHGLVAHLKDHEWNRSWPQLERDRNFIAFARNKMPAMIAALEAMQAERDAAIKRGDIFQRTTRAHWEALCAMRDSINEYIPMPNTDSGPLFSPEDGPIYADIAQRVVTRLKCDTEYITGLENELKARADLPPSDAAVMAHPKVRALVEALTEISCRPGKMIWGEDTEVGAAMCDMEEIANTALAALKGYGE